MGNPLIDIVKRIRLSEVEQSRQFVADPEAFVGDGYNVLYLEFKVVNTHSIEEDWIKPSSFAPSVGQLVTFSERGTDKIDGIWPKMAGRYFVLADRATQWTRYRLFEFYQDLGTVKIERDDDRPAYRYRVFTAYCRAAQGSGFSTNEQITLKLPDMDGRDMAGVIKYPMATPTTFAVTAQVDGHKLTIAADDDSMLAAGFLYWEVEQADNGSGLNAVSLVYGPSDMPALVEVTPGVTKYYRVRAVSKLGDVSAWSAYTSAVYDVVPAVPAWASHLYQIDGHAVSWTHQDPATVNYYVLYRNTSASTTGATVVGTSPRYSTGYVIPYGSGGDYFGIKAVGYTGSDNGVVWFGPYSPTPAATPSPTVQMVDLGGFVVSWSPVEKAISYEVQTATSAAGAGAILATTVAQPTNAATVYTGTLRKAGYKYYRVRAVGYGATTSGWSAWLTDSTAPGQPSITKVTEDNNQVSIYIPSSYAKPVGFSHYIVQRADNSSGGNLATVDSAAGWTQTLSYPLSWPMKYYRLIAVDVAGNQSTPSAWVASAYVSGEPAVQDRFDGYGGSTTSPLESLWWWQLSNMDDINYFTGSAAVANSSLYFKEGVGSIKFWPGYGPPNRGETGTVRKTINLDLTKDGRFTENDYIVFPYYVSDLGDGISAQLTVQFIESRSPLKYKTSDSIYITQTGWQLFKQKRSVFSDYGGASWANITEWLIDVWPGGTEPNVITYIDDVRIVKADPDDATTYNDTGNAWDKAASSGSDVGEWHIYAGNRAGEPSKPFSYGQIKTVTSPAVWYLTHKPMTTNIVTGTVQAGIYLKGANGKAGLAFFIKDVTPASWDMYAVEVDSAADTIKLVKWVGGTRTALGSAAFTCAPNQIVWVGIDFRGFLAESDAGRIKVHATLTEGGVIRADTLKISLKDTSLSAGGSVGVVSYQANCRFVDFTAGSPAHAEVADVAKMLDGPMIDGQSGDGRVYLSIDGGNLEFSQDKDTWTALAGKSDLDRINEFYYVSYYVSGNVTLASWTPLTITNYAMFHSSNWPTTPSSGQFTIPVTGYYLVEATLTYIVTTTGHIYGLYIYLTSSGVAHEKAINRIICANGGQQTFVTASAMLLLSAGETISMKALSSIACTNAIATNNGLLSNLNITLIRRTA